MAEELVTAMLKLPNGARFYRCALQVNPYAYLMRHSKETEFASEAEYNNAVIQTCIDTNIEVIGVTDHYRVRDSMGLVRAAREKGLWAFAGFEAVSKDGVHFLCLFDPDKDEVLERFIGDCGIYDATDLELSPTGTLDSLALLERVKRWDGIGVAAHVAGDGGLLKTLSGQPRINVWTSPSLLACALPGPLDDAPINIRPILKNTDGQHRRARQIAIINASDVNSPDDLKNNRSSCFIKMSEVSVEAFRQAFLDPESRIRLHSDHEPEPHAECLGIAWEGGFLRDTAVHFNENLNVLVGGRGTGKSTIVESIRYVLGLDPFDEQTRKTHQSMIQHVLQAGTKISLWVQSHKPNKRCYTIERTVPNPAIVKDESGVVLALAPRDVMPGVQIFGQHEISELTKSPEQLTLLLQRFVEHDPSLSDRKTRVGLELEKSRRRIVEVQREIDALNDRLGLLPGLEEKHTRFQKAGLEEKLKEKSLIIREEQLFSRTTETLDEYRRLYSELKENLPIDTAFASSKALAGLPNANILNNLAVILQSLSERLESITDQLAQALQEADQAIAHTKIQWDKQRINIQNTYEKLLRELQKSKINGAEFIQLRQQIEQLRPLKGKAEHLHRDLGIHQGRRRQLLTEWEDLKAREYHCIERAAKKVSRKLRDRVQVTVTMAGAREPLELLLREVGGNLAAALDRLRALEQLSLLEFSKRCQEGKQALMDHYGFPPGAAERIAQGGVDRFMRIEELELPATTTIKLNTAAGGQPPQWQSMEALSTGQKATAILLLLLLESDAPLVIDQPEDDLDNRFISESVVPIMRQEKRRRQFIFSTHNANIPVLGDAELILGLIATGEAKEGYTKIASSHMGSIDSPPVRELVEEILEGGKDAFETRRSKYGF